MFYNAIHKIRRRSAAGMKHRADQQDYQYLLDSSDRLLRDIGVTRLDVISRKNQRFQFNRSKFE